MKFKGMKFYIGDNPRLSKRLQKVLFDMGYTWSAGETGVCFTNKPYLYTGSDGSVTHGSVPHHFDQDTRPKIDLDWMGGSRETITMEGITYYKDEVMDVLLASEIKPVPDCDSET